jgi:parvulin-like peptidyl-prolyl isomerase
MSLEIEKIIESEVNTKVTVGDADVDTFYKQNIERFKEGESVHAAHILIAVPQTADAAQKAAGKAKAQEILKQARASGADFAKLAKDNSQDPGSAPNGGDLGFFPKGQMTPTFEAAAFKLKPGAISDVVETPFGYHIIKVIERRPARTVPLAEIGPRVKEFLTQNERQAKLEKFIEQAKTKTKIEILV